jgi:hypothetical protein
MMPGTWRDASTPYRSKMLLEKRAREDEVSSSGAVKAVERRYRR